MRKIAIFILFLMCISYISARSFLKRNNRAELCALPRDQLFEFSDCFDGSLSDESRDIIHGYLGCIGFSSIFDFLEKSCVNNDDMDETLLKAFLCSYEYEERLKTVVTREDENKCLEKVTPAIVE
ncbi:uncharacterized protein [Centruroides vittatus]|uniref:uncharacterized protein n=1 Tax=Centruroides vittatus TaxID=120091 RepID=UPI00350F0C1E